jgi:hypothetical protein
LRNRAGGGSLSVVETRALVQFLAVSGAVVFAGLAVVHVRWAFTGPGASSAGIPTRADGSPVLNPGPVAALGVAALLLASAWLLLERAGLGLDLLTAPMPAIGTAGVAVILLLRGIGDFRYVGLFKRVRDTPFARMDSRVYTPLVLALAAVAGLVATKGTG